jgi:acetate kinase
LRVLVLNAGSSSLKATLLDHPAPEPLADAASDWATGEAPLASLLARLGTGAGEVAAVGHRIVHGGARFVEPVVIDDAVTGAIEADVELAPVHNGRALEVLAAAKAALPDVPHVAVFDTSFHSTLPESAWRYPVPDEWHDRWGVRRFGFHGSSVEWSVRRAAELLGRPADELHLVVAHLGGGSSVTAVAGGRSVATSMGLTPLEGLMMGTRSGSIDPGALLRVVVLRDGDIEGVTDDLEHRSGLHGVSGISGDVREIEAAVDRGDARAALALAMFVERAAAGIAAAATSLPRLDAVVFTGGIGTNAVRVRAAIVEKLQVLGIGGIHAAARGDVEDGRLNDGGAVAVLRVEAREDLVIADAVVSLAT